MKTFLKKQFLDKNFLLFFFANTFAAIVNFGSRILLGQVMTYGWSIIVAYLIGMSVSYFFCGRYIFQAKENKTTKQVSYFIAVNVVGILIALGVSLFLFHIVLFFIQDVFLREEVAHFFGLCAPVFASYLGHKYITFR